MTWKLLVALFLLITDSAVLAANKDVDIRGYKSDNETYYVIFAGRGITTQGPGGESSPAGHAFVIWRDKSGVGPVPLKDKSFGLYPKETRTAYGPGILRKMKTA